MAESQHQPRHRRSSTGREARRYLEIGVAELRQAAVIAYGLLSSKIGGGSVRVLNDFQRY